MKTLVELYDKEPIDNIISSCIFEPDHVVYLCDINDHSMRKEQAVYKLLQRRKMKTLPRFYYVDTGNPAAINRALSAIVRDWPQCVFDLTGGKDLALLCAGAFCERHKIPCYYIDLYRRRLLPIQKCEDIQETFQMPKLRAEDILGAAGAGILGYGHFPLSLIDEEFEQDISNVWDCIMQAPHRWGGIAGYFQAVFRNGDEERLAYRVRPKIRVSDQTLAKADTAMLEKLANIGILTQLQVEKEEIQFTVKNELVKKCLSNHGIWLELYGYLCAKQTGWFDDVRTSLLIDWDGENRHNGTRNEVDIFLLKGTVPIFISCKMGAPTALALSEIKLLSKKFGGEAAKTVLLTASTVKLDNPVLATRAKDMEIILIDRSDLGQKDLGQRFIKIAQTR